MALVDTSTGEVVAHCTPDEARRITDDIKGAAESIYALLGEAHRRQAWSALGYESFTAYATSEFGMSEVHAYRLVGQAEVIREIESATGLTHGLVGVSERVARDVKPRLKAVTDSIRAALAEEADAPAPDRVQAIVAEVVEQERAKAKQESEDAAALAQLSNDMTSAGMDMNKDSLAERGKWSSNCREIGAMPEAAEFIDRHRSHFTARHIAQAERAYAWLDEFLLILREAE